MPIRYYPISKIKTDKVTKGGQFILNGKEYIGPYYETFDGKFFTGNNPILGKNEKLEKINFYKGADYINYSELTQKQRKQLAIQTRLTPDKAQLQDLPSFPGFKIPQPVFKDEPTTYTPYPIEQDYTQGFIMRYFVKRTNSNGYVKEISEQEYSAIKTGEVPYDVSFYHAIKIMWKLTGPLNKKRISQYDVRAGIIDTNKRLVEQADKTFLGIVDFIGGKYDKFARPTE